MAKKNAHAVRGPDTVADEVSPDAARAAGPSAPVPASTTAAASARTSKKRKAGGSGKKGKVFLEDKAGLMHLIDSVTASKDSIAAGKIERNRERAQVVRAKEGDRKVVSRKTAERAEALDRAKEAIREKEKERRRKKKGGPAEDAPAKPKKRVGFA